MATLELSVVNESQWVIGYRDGRGGFQYVAAVDAVGDNQHRIYDIDVIHASQDGVTELQSTHYETPETALAAVNAWYTRTHLG